MRTGSHTPLSNSALFNGWFFPKTKYFIQPYWTCTFSKISSLMHTLNTFVSQAPADDQSSTQFPAVVTHRTPLAFVENLHSAFVRAAATHQSDCIRWSLQWIKQDVSENTAEAGVEGNRSVQEGSSKALLKIRWDNALKPLVLSKCSPNTHHNYSMVGEEALTLVSWLLWERLGFIQGCAESSAVIKWKTYWYFISWCEFHCM